MPQGKSMTQEIGATQYMEISAKTRQGLVNLFQESINTVLTTRGDPRATKSGKSGGGGKGKSGGKNCQLL